MTDVFRVEVVWTGVGSLFRHRSRLPRPARCLAGPAFDAPDVLSPSSLSETVDFIMHVCNPSATHVLPLQAATCGMNCAQAAQCAPPVTDVFFLEHVLSRSMAGVGRLKG